MATAIDDGIEIENVGPNRQLSLPYLLEGGVVVLTGPNDTGKSEALRAVSRVAGADEKLTRTFGVASMGHVEMARLWRFAPSGHPLFDDRLPLFEEFMSRFNSLGGMTPAVSKAIGWE